MMSKSERIVRAGLPDLLARLWRYALVLTKDETAAELLTQATVAQAVEMADEYPVGTRLPAWCFGIMALSYQTLGQNRLVANGTPKLPKLDKTALDPKMKAMFDYVLTLPLTQRVTVFLVYVEGYKYREAADLMNVPIGTVMSRLSESRKILHAILDDAPDALPAR